MITWWHTKSLFEIISYSIFDVHFTAYHYFFQKYGVAFSGILAFHPIICSNTNTFVLNWCVRVVTVKLSTLLLSLPSNRGTGTKFGETGAQTEKRLPWRLTESWSQIQKHNSMFVCGIICSLYTTPCLSTVWLDGCTKPNSLFSWLFVKGMEGNSH